ncbi:hypothetical protein FQN57_006935 [Myotisia sp. PD_48]|nr:hypothetical protein FQN57_006935 [Myotisia sp. PD_48]
MASLVIPDGGVTLRRMDPPGDASPDSHSKPTQIMRLNLAQNTLDELLQSLRSDKKARIRLGKNPSLQFNSKPHPFYAYSQGNRSELYHFSSPNNDHNLYFSGVLSHTLEVQRATEATAATDEALTNLERSMNAFEKGKESKRTPMITTIHQMKALGAGDNRSATGKEAASLARLSTSRSDQEKERIFSNAANRSMSSSPALLNSHSPAAFSISATPTSAPTSLNKEKVRLEAIRVPLLHLLAIRPVSVKFLSQRTRSSPDDCLTLVQKYCNENRLDREKFDLRDKVYKDLDIWDFPYPSQDERQEAIDNAISAFDRMRISKQDKLWQMLLPKEERGKGKVLSRLNLRTAPLGKSITPLIQVQSSEEVTGEGYATGTESEAALNGRLTPNAPDLYSASAKSTASKKKNGLEKALSSKRGTTKPKNTTLTGKVTKKTDRKGGKMATAKPDAKFKSAEFVLDSDDDTEMVDTPNGDGMPLNNRSVPKPPRRVQERGSEPKKTVSTTPQSASNTTIPVSISARPAASKATSPLKPSPLGSSPPTNASDVEQVPRSSHNSQSSSSSSPLIHQRPRQRPASSISTRPTDPADRPRNPQPKPNTLKRKTRPDDDIVNTRNTRTFPPIRAVPIGLGISQNASRRLDSNRRPSSISSGDSTSGSASPPLSQTILRQNLVLKSQKFKQFYVKYRSLHEEMANHLDPPLDQIRKLERQHTHLQKMKQEIWDEDRRLRMG